MGSKNKKLLGIITSIILHHIRNRFDSKELYITKRKILLIEEKHPLEFIYIKTNQFQNILDCTIAKCDYTKDGEVLNFISYINETYVLYGIANNSYYTHLTTLFYPSNKQLKNCFTSMKFFNEKYKKDLEDYLK